MGACPEGLALNSPEPTPGHGRNGHGLARSFKHTMSSLSRLLSIFNLFTQDRPAWSTEEIAQQLDCSIPTAYRYLRELTSMQLLRSASPGQYVLGTKIIELDYLIRTGDPLIQAGSGPIKQLAREVDCDVAVISLSGMSLITIHYEPSRIDMLASYGRGRQMPAFRGAMSLAVLANLSKPMLRKVYDAHQEEAQHTPGAQTLEELTQQLKAIRKAGYASSQGALDPENAGLAIPFNLAEHGIAASLGLVMPMERFRLLEVQKALGWLRHCETQIQHHLKFPRKQA